MIRNRITEYWSTQKEINFFHSLDDIEAKIKYYFALNGRDIWGEIDKDVLIKEVRKTCMADKYGRSVLLSNKHKGEIL